MSSTSSSSQLPPANARLCKSLALSGTWCAIAQVQPLNPHHLLWIPLPATATLRPAFICTSAVSLLTSRPDPQVSSHPTYLYFERHPLSTTHRNHTPPCLDCSRTSSSTMTRRSAARSVSKSSTSRTGTSAPAHAATKYAFVPKLGEPSRVPC